MDAPQYLQHAFRAKRGTTIVSMWFQTQCCFCLTSLNSISVCRINSVPAPRRLRLPQREKPDMHPQKGRLLPRRWRLYAVTADRQLTYFACQNNDFLSTNCTFRTETPSSSLSLSLSLVSFLTSGLAHVVSTTPFLRPTSTVDPTPVTLGRIADRPASLVETPKAWAHRWS